MFQKRMTIQAVDPLTGIWTKGKVLGIDGDTAIVTWPGYDSQYDCEMLINNDKMRLSEQERRLPSRTMRGRFSGVSQGEKVRAVGRTKTMIASINDPFKGEVCNFLCILYTYCIFIRNPLFYKKPGEGPISKSFYFQPKIACFWFQKFLI